MAKKKTNKQGELALTILDKCKELGCQCPNDTAELIGSATLIILNTLGEYLGMTLDEVRDEYIRGLKEAEIEKG